MSKGRTLVAVDGSREARKAIGIGLKPAADRRHRVGFLHVAPDIAGQVYALDPMDGPTKHQMAAADPALAEVLGMARAKGVGASIEVVGAARERSPLDESAGAIIGVAEGLAAGLIVVGSRGHWAIANAVQAACRRVCCIWPRARSSFARALRYPV